MTTTSTINTNPIQFHLSLHSLIPTTISSYIWRPIKKLGPKKVNKNEIVVIPVIIKFVILLWMLKVYKWLQKTTQSQWKNMYKLQSK